MRLEIVNARVSRVTTTNNLGSAEQTKIGARDYTFDASKECVGLGRVTGNAARCLHFKFTCHQSKPFDSVSA